MDEFDRVLGGLVQGGVVLLGGDPGIGKSTLLLQALSRMSVHHRVLYVSGEESMQQVALRARRLSLDVARVDLLTEIRLEAINRFWLSIVRVSQLSIRFRQFIPKHYSLHPVRWLRCVNVQHD